MKTLRLLLLVSTWLSIVASCLWLGVWQLHRLEWKTRWESNINAAYQGDVDKPLPLVPAQVFPPYHDNTSFYRGRIRGEMYDMTSLLIGPRTHDGKVGWHWYALLRLSEDKSIWTNRGFVPIDFIPERINSATVTVTGALRPPEFVGAVKQIIQQPDKDGKLQIKWLDAGAFTATSLAAAGTVSPFVLYAETPTSYDPGLILMTERPRLRNDHLNYAIFWFVMAVIAGGFGALGVRRSLTNQQA